MKPGMVIWKVHVPAGQWMAGVQTFGTKGECLEFMEKHAVAARNAGDPLVTWTRDANAKVFRGKV